MLKRNTNEYKNVHARIARDRGLAVYFKCVDCQSKASEWSWIHGEPQDDNYSYEPRCKSCHAKYDERPPPINGKGELNSQCKLKDQAVLEIREKYSTGRYSHRELASMYNVGRSHISRILNRQAR